MRAAYLVIPCVLALALAGCGPSGDGGGGPNVMQQYKEAGQNANPEIAATQLVRVAYLLKRAGDGATAERAANDAARRAGEIKDAGGKAMAFKDVAAVQGFLSMRTETKTSLKAAQAAAEQMEAGDRKAEVLGRVGVIYGNSLNDADSARYWLEEAEKAVEAAADPVAKTRGLITVAGYFNLWTAEEGKAGAERLTKEAQAAAAAIANPRDKAGALGDIAAKLDQMKKTAEAKAMYDEALTVARAIPEDFSHAFALCDLVEKMTKSRPQEAITLLGEAEKVADTVKDPGLKTQAREQVSRLKRDL